MSRLLVRCCCEPNRVLGVLDGVNEQFERQRFATYERVCPVFDFYSEPVNVRANVVELPIRDFIVRKNGDIMRIERAVESHETPMHVLKRVQGFTPIIWLRQV
jgi:hypothetical protein